MAGTNLSLQQIKTGLEAFGFKVETREISSFQDDYGLKVGDGEGDDDEDEDDEDGEEEDGDEEEGDDDGDEDDEE